VGFGIPIRGKNPLHLPNQFFFVYILSVRPIFLTSPLFLVLLIGIGVWRPPPQSPSSFKAGPFVLKVFPRSLKVILLNPPSVYFLGHAFLFYRLETSPSMSRNLSLVDQKSPCRHCMFVKFPEFCEDRSDRLQVSSANFSYLLTPAHKIQIPCNMHIFSLLCQQSLHPACLCSDQTGQTDVCVQRPFPIVPSSFICFIDFFLFLSTYTCLYTLLFKKDNNHVRKSSYPIL
jgi:hypothetical protein